MIALKVFREKLFLQHVYIQLWTFLTQVWPHPSPGDQYLYKLEDTLPVIQVSVFSGLMVFFIWKCVKIVLYIFSNVKILLSSISSTGEFFYMNSSLEPPTRVSLKCIAIAHFVCKNPCPIYYNICLGLVLRNNTTTQANFLF